MTDKLSNNATDAWIQLHRAHRVLLENVEISLKKNKLPPLDWYDVLLELHREKENGLRQYEIGEKVLLNKHNLSRLIDRLEQKQLLKRQPCLDDARGNVILITKRGEKTLDEMWPIYSQAIQTNFSEKLNADELRELSKSLTKLLL